MTYLYTLNTRHVMSKVVNTHINMTIFLRVGRSFSIEEMRDPTVTSSVTLCNVLFPSDVEFRCVPGGRVCGSPWTPQATTIHRVMTKPYDNIVFRSSAALFGPFRENCTGTA